MTGIEFYRRLLEMIEAGRPLVLVTVIDTHGSVPTNVSDKMIVTSSGIDCGSVGGGRLEAQAIDQAIGMFTGEQRWQTTDWSLKADVGMTCGGRVSLSYEAFNVAAWKIVIFGAGHVTQALTKVLATLACDVTCIDPRSDWLARLPAGIHVRVSDDPPAHVDSLSDDTYVLCLTRGHKSDRPVLQRIFETQRSFPFLGVIGSKAKAAVLRKELIEAGIPPQRIEFHCPVGLPIGNNDPAEIAISITSQLLQCRGLLSNRNKATT